MSASRDRANWLRWRTPRQRRSRVPKFISGIAVADRRRGVHGPNYRRNCPPASIKVLLLTPVWITSGTAARPDQGEHSPTRDAGLYMLGAGVPSDHLSTTTANTRMAGKLLSCGYACADKYQ